MNGEVLANGNMVTIVFSREMSSLLVSDLVIAYEAARSTKWEFQCSASCFELHKAPLPYFAHARSCLPVSVGKLWAWGDFGGLCVRKNLLECGGWRET